MNNYLTNNEERRSTRAEPAPLNPQFNIDIPSETARIFYKKYGSYLHSLMDTEEGQQNTVLVGIKQLWELFVELAKELQLEEIIDMEEFSEFRITMSR